MLSTEDQARLRLEIFHDLELMSDRRGGYLARSSLLGYSIRGEALPLIDYSRGIRNPRQLDATLSIVSAVDGPYDDTIDPVTGILRYAFRAGDPNGTDNRKLRVAREQGTPIILFEKPLPGMYVPIFPVFVIDEDTEQRVFIIATTEASWTAYSNPQVDKRYVQQSVRRRVHQPVFRARVLDAYTTTCAVCRLKHVELLDAAHIIPDSAAHGLPVVANGLALCKIHHAAYDQNMLGIDPGHRVHINADLLLEIDGPMLKHGLQEMNGVTIRVPERSSLKPNRDGLAERFEKFIKHR